MTQMGIAAGAAGFGANHAMAAIDHLFDGARFGGLPKAGPATAGVKFGGRVKQQGTAANAVVTARLPMVFVLAREWALGGGVACDFKRQGLGALLAQPFFPLVIGLGQGVHGSISRSTRQAASGLTPGSVKASQRESSNGMLMILFPISEVAASPLLP
jgi:hypothetical protein